MTKTPRSGYDTCGSLAYFPRMLSKVRLFAAGELREDFHANLGGGADGFMCEFLHVNYEELRRRVLEGGTDKEILKWCHKNGRTLNGTDVMVWNHFIQKLGWNDKATGRLEQYKAEGGLSARKDIVTLLHCMEADEGREPRGTA